MCSRYRILTPPYAGTERSHYQRGLVGDELFRRRYPAKHASGKPSFNCAEAGVRPPEPRDRQNRAAETQSASDDLGACAGRTRRRGDSRSAGAGKVLARRLRGPVVVASRCWRRPTACNACPSRTWRPVRAARARPFRIVERSRGRRCGLRRGRAGAHTRRPWCSSAGPDPGDADAAGGFPGGRQAACERCPGCCGSGPRRTGDRYSPANPSAVRARSSAWSGRPPSRCTAAKVPRRTPRRTDRRTSGAGPALPSRSAGRVELARSCAISPSVPRTCAPRRARGQCDAVSRLGKVTGRLVESAQVRYTRPRLRSELAPAFGSHCRCRTSAWA